MATPLEEARLKWPASVSELTPRVQAVYPAWLSLCVPELTTAISGSPVAIVSPGSGRYRKPERARDLTLARAPFPAGTASAPAVLTEAEVQAIGAVADSDDEAESEGSSSEIADLHATVRN